MMEFSYYLNLKINYLQLSVTSFYFNIQWPVSICIKIDSTGNYISILFSLEAYDNGSVANFVYFAKSRLFGRTILNLVFQNWQC